MLGGLTAKELASLGRLPDGCKLLKLLDGCFGNQNAWDKKDVILKNEPEKLLIIKHRPLKANPSEPKSEAGKLLKIRTC